MTRTALVAGLRHRLDQASRVGSPYVALPVAWVEELLAPAAATEAGGDDEATAELLRALDELYPLLDDARRVERAGRTACVLKRWMARQVEALAAAALRLAAAAAPAPRLEQLELPALRMRVDPMMSTDVVAVIVSDHARAAELRAQLVRAGVARG